MARISFTSEMEEIIGKYGGSVFQDSYFGIQLRGLAKPRNPQTELQQLRRGDFRFLSSAWRYLTSPDQTTWLSAAGTAPSALRLFIGSNINLILVEQPIITSYTPITALPIFEVEITTLTETSFIITASGLTTVVPDDSRLLVYATTDEHLTHTFVNPSDYQPIHYFVAGTDLTGDHEIFTYWTNHYGVLRQDRRICVKAVLISTVNGERSPESITCATVPTIAEHFLIDSDGTFIIDSDTSKIIADA